MNNYTVEMEIAGRYKTIVLADSIEEAKKKAIRYCGDEYAYQFNDFGCKIKSIENGDCIFNY